MGSGCNGRPIGFVAGKPGLKARCPQAAACRRVVSTQRSRPRFPQRTTGLTLNSTLADAAEKCRDSDSGRSRAATIDLDRIFFDRLHPMAADSRCRRPCRAACLRAGALPSGDRRHFRAGCGAARGADAAVHRQQRLATSQLVSALDKRLLVPLRRAWPWTRIIVRTDSVFFLTDRLRRLELALSAQALRGDRQAILDVTFLAAPTQFKCRRPQHCTSGRCPPPPAAWIKPSPS